MKVYFVWHLFFKWMERGYEARRRSGMNGGISVGVYKKVLSEIGVIIWTQHDDTLVFQMTTGIVLVLMSTHTWSSIYGIYITKQKNIYSFSPHNISCKGVNLSLGFLTFYPKVKTGALWVLQGASSHSTKLNPVLCVVAHSRTITTDHSSDIILFPPASMTRHTSEPPATIDMSECRVNQRDNAR